MSERRQQLAAARAAVTARWGALAPRERHLVAVAIAVLLAYALWAIGIAPAWRSLRDAPARAEALELQWQAMQRLAAEAGELRALPALPKAQAEAALNSAAARLGGDKARLSWQGDRAVLTVTGLPAGQLVAWIGEVRLSARVRVVEAQLARTPQDVYIGTLNLALGGTP